MTKAAVTDPAAAFREINWVNRGSAMGQTNRKLSVIPAGKNHRNHEYNRARLAEMRYRAQGQLLAELRELHELGVDSDECWIACGERFKLISRIYGDAEAAR